MLSWASRASMTTSPHWSYASWPKRFSAFCTERDSGRGANRQLPRQPRFPHNRVMTAREFAEQICSVLRGAGYQAYLVGGCVRDILLGREPADYDVATAATPDRVEEIFPNSLTGGAQL